MGGRTDQGKYFSGKNRLVNGEEQVLVTEYPEGGWRGVPMGVFYWS